MSNLGEEGGEGAEKERASPNPSALRLDTVNEIFKYVAVETIKEGVFVCVCVSVCVLVIPKGVFNWNQPQLFNCVLNWTEIKRRSCQ